MKTGRKKRTLRTIWVCIFMLILLVPMLGAAPAGVISDNSWESKISPELALEMQQKDDGDTIFVWLWLKSIGQDTINQILIKETGFDTALYETSERYQKEVVAKIEADIVSQMGYEKAHKAPSAEEIAMQAETAAKAGIPVIKSAYENQSPVNRALQLNVDNYIMSKRGITQRLFSANNEDFIARNGIEGKQRKILYNSRYTSTLIVEATKAEIESYARQFQVEEISLYKETVPEPGLNIVPQQINADRSTGTKSPIFFGKIYSGQGIKIGILEAGSGRFDSNAPQLKSIYNTRLFLANDAGPNGTAITSTVERHATMVTSYIVGQAVAVAGRTYEGIVPDATVYQTPVDSTSDVHRALQKMADRGVSVVNYSGGSDTNEHYAEHDREVDRILANTNITFVTISHNYKVDADNNRIHVTSPGKALNAITVGNANTKASATSANSPPYNMYSASLYAQGNYFPNKPDIVAPGTNICFVRSAGTLYTATGTSSAAPMVAGVVAQMMQADSYLKTNPTMVKSKLLLGAEANLITTTGNPTAGNNYLREKSGAGFVNAVYSVMASTTTNHYSVAINKTGMVYFAERNFTAGQKVRAVLAFDKVHTGLITASSHFDDIDLRIVNMQTGATVSSSLSSRNNVEIIEYNIPSTGKYSLQIVPVRIIDASKLLHISLSWRTF